MLKRLCSEVFRQVFRQATVVPPALASATAGDTGSRVIRGTKAVAGP